MSWLSSVMSPSSELLFQLALALFTTLIGFQRVVYFISLGYAGSVAVLMGQALYRSGGKLPLVVMAQCLLLVLYGLRLGSFLLLRERLPSYRKELADVESRSGHIGSLRKLAIWIGVSILYVVMCSPATLNIERYLIRQPDAGTVAPSISVLVGVLVMVGGLLLEAWADRQKESFKRQFPSRFCDVKLYRLVRCPNYLGETLFWLGNFVCGLSAYTELWHWAASVSGWVCITLVMIGSTKRLERKQDERYGSDPEYQRYVQTVPVLIPLVPLYSLKRWRIALG